MFEPAPELASDLEWMLGSDQVSSEMLLDALVDEYYATLIQVSTLVLDDNNAAKTASQESIAQILVNKYHYRVDMGVKKWITQFAIKAIQKQDKQLQSQHKAKSSPKTYTNDRQNELSIHDGSLDERIWLFFDNLKLSKRVLVILYLFQNWSTEELAVLFKRQGEEIEQTLHYIWDLLDKNLKEQYPDRGQQNREAMTNLVRSSLERRWEQVRIPNIPEAETIENINQISKQLNLRRKSYSYFKEILLVLVIIMSVAGFIWGGNTFFPDRQATETPISTVVVTKIIVAEDSQEQNNPSGALRVTQTPKISVATPIPEEVLYEVDYGEKIDDIAENLGISPATLQDLNRIPNGVELEPGTQLLIPGSLPKDRRYATAVPTAEARLPLSTPFSEADIFRRLRGSSPYFNTLWLEAYIADYGPLGYVGPPKILLTQAWLSDHQSLILVGSPDKGVEEVLLRNGIYWYLAQPGNKQPWFYSQDGDGPLNMQFYPELNLLINSLLGGRREFGPELAYYPQDRVEWAGQSTILVEGRDEANRRLLNFWLEDTRQIVMRKQWYSQSDPGIISQEIAVTDIQYDVEFPQEFFDASYPWLGGFAEDYRGGPIPISDISPLPFIIEAQSSRQVVSTEPGPYNLAELEFAKAQLTFSFQNNFNVRNPSAPADLYLDRRFIGTALIGNPWTSVCQRSPDGRKLAFVSHPVRFNSLNSQLRWLNLDGPFGLGRALDDMVVTNFSWAPDSRHLAVFGYDPLSPSQTGHLIILDSKTGEAVTLVEVDSANSLVWKPDGKRLAMIVRTLPDSFEEQIFVIDTDNGGIVNRIPIDIDNGYSDNWPMEDWGVEFPVLMGNIEDCALPVQ